MKLILLLACFVLITLPQGGAAIKKLVPEAACPEIDACEQPCVHGYAQDEKGCMTCKCLEAQAHKGAHSWGYHGDHGPAHWRGACKDGIRQSPINIVTEKTVYNDQMGDFYSWHQLENLPEVSMYIVNDGHKISIGVEGGDIIVNGGSLGSSFKVAGAHFHWGDKDSYGSEHTVDGKAFPLEMHIVTFDNERFDTVGEALKGTDSLAVLGVLFQIQEQNNTILEKVVDKFDSIMSPNGSVKINVPKVPLNKMLPAVTARFYRYYGSLTTPGCFENVIWTVFEEPVGISSYQMNKFRSLMRETGEQGGKPLVNNYRPVQSLNARKVIASFPVATHHGYNVNDNVNNNNNNKPEPYNAGTTPAINIFIFITMLLVTLM